MQGTPTRRASLAHRVWVRRMASAYCGAVEGPIGAVCGVTAGQKQYGALKQTTAADPDGAGAGQPLVRQYVYDSAGRQVGSRVGYGSGTGAVASAGWVCATFDSRGRPATVTFPAFGRHKPRLGR